MSLTMHLYDPDICDGHYCPKDCEDHCPWAEEVLEKQAEENSYTVEEIIEEVRGW